MSTVLMRVCALGLTAVTGAAGTPLSFASLFQGGAVLQRGEEVAVWGTSDAKSVTLTLDDQIVATAAVDATGTWRAQLPPQSTGWQRSLGAQDSSGNAVEVPVSFGIVILCSGQSNMDMPVYMPDGGFAAQNGSAEVAACERYTDKIWFATVQMKGGSDAGWNGTSCGQYASPDCVNHIQWNKVTQGTLPQFSAVCWYTGRDLFDRLGGEVPIGLMKGSVGGSPIEFWLPPGHVNNSICGVDDPPCDQKKWNDSDFYNFYIKPLAPYTLGAVVWDQGERDVHCYAPATNTTARYPCMENELIWSWQKVFNSSFAFVAVQLPGYIGDCDAPGANPNSTYDNCVPGVFDMRLAQEAGTEHFRRATVSATYDLSCPFGVKTDACPHGSVHNERKQPIGERLAATLHRFLEDGAADLVTEGPRAQEAMVSATDGGRSTVSVRFHGGTAPLYLRGTQYCAACCDAGVGDFDASADGGITWMNATGVHELSKGGTTITFVVPSSTVTHVRYTANQAFPQCAVYNQEGLPALPFEMHVATLAASVV